jgi:radical SAM superfamily enzyme YgiQ (UPF0313 family)
MNVLLVGTIAPPMVNKVSSGCLPFGAMALSAFLKQQGIPCKVVSTALPGAIDEICTNLDNLDLLGISSMSGPYLGYAISIVKNIKAAKPHLPMVWGGPHASLMDEDLVINGLADFVIRGVGEKALYKLILYLKGGLPLSSVPGLTHKEKGRVIRNELEPDFNIDEFPQLDYSFLKDNYLMLLRKEFPYFSSRGCPFNCSFCVASALYHRHWYNKSEEKIVNELTESYQKYKFNSISFQDDNLFVDVKRLCNILSRLNKLDIHFQWSGFCRADIFSKINNEIMVELKDRGLKWIGIGAESGCQETLQRLNKGVQLAQIKQSVIRLKNLKVACDFSFMGGIPAETKDDFYKTLDLVKWIKQINPEASIRVFRFTPYPKMPILDYYKEVQNFLPQNSYEWCKVSYQNSKFSWVPKEIDRALIVFSAASHYGEKPKGRTLKKLIMKALYYLMQFRIKNNMYDFPFEGLIFNVLYSKISLKILNNFDYKMKEQIQNLYKFQKAYG